MLAAVRVDRDAGRADGRGRRPTCWPSLRRGAPASAPSSRPPSGRLEAEVDEGLWDLVARGIVTADAFSAVRSLLSARPRRASGARPRDRPGAPPWAGTGLGGDADRRGTLVAAARRPTGRGTGPQAGRRPRSWPRPWPGSCWPAGVSWPGSSGPASPTGSRGATWCGPCAGSRPAGQALGGRFVAGISGEQYALAEAVALLGRGPPRPRPRRRGRRGRRRPAQPDRRLAGRARVPAVRHRSVHYQGGVPADLVVAASSNH